MPSRTTKMRILGEVRRQIEEHGWAVQAIGAQCSVPGCCAGSSGRSEEADFGYTVGLSRYHGHPELIVTGIPQTETIQLLNLMAAAVRDGERFAAGDVFEGVLEDGLLAFLRVDPRQSARHLLAANELYRKPGGPPVQALQIVWTDRGHRFPWDPGYSLPEPVQPVLGPPPVV